MSKSVKIGQEQFGNLWKNILALTIILLIATVTVLSLFSFALTFAPAPEKIYSIAEIVILATGAFLGGKVYSKYKSGNNIIVFLISSIVFSALLFLVAVTAYGELPSYIDVLINFLTVFFSLVASFFIKSTKPKRRKRRKR